MKLADLIQELQDIAARNGGHLEAEVRGQVSIENEDGLGWFEPVTQAVIEVCYPGGYAVQIVV